MSCQTLSVCFSSLVSFKPWEHHLGHNTTFANAILPTMPTPLAFDIGVSKPVSTTYKKHIS